MTQAVESVEKRESSEVAGEALAAFIKRYPKLWVITGAGVSTDSGIPDYRDADGQWKRPPPVQHGDFMSSFAVRQRYWARALVGFKAMREAQVSGAHRALAELEAMGHSVDVRAGGYGGYQGIRRDPATGVFYGATESRKDGIAAGY